MPHQAPDDVARWRPLLDAGLWFAALSALPGDALPRLRLRRLAAGQALFARRRALRSACRRWSAVRIRHQGGNAVTAAVLLTLLGAAPVVWQVSLFDGAPRTHDAPCRGHHAVAVSAAGRRWCNCSCANLRTGANWPRWMSQYKPGWPCGAGGSGLPLWRSGWPAAWC